MLDTFLHRPDRSSGFAEPALAAALARAAAAIARLDQSLIGHPLQTAFLYRVRLEAVRRQAAVDGQLIDPWHLAALLEGLRLRMEGALRMVDRGAIFDAARHAFDLHQWLTAPDPDQENAVRLAASELAATEPSLTPLLAAAIWLHGWLDRGGDRPPARAALIRYWMDHRLVRIPIPLTGAAALRSDMPWDRSAWMPGFLAALADEAEDALQLLMQLERAWFTARAAVAGRRRHSRAAHAIDLLAAAPMLSASTLAAGLGMALKNAAALLDAFRAAGLVIEVTHRSKRRLFGLAGLASLREAVAAPRRPEPGRSRGRPALIIEEPELPISRPPPVPLAVVERRAFDYDELTEAMVLLDQVIRRTKRKLDTIVRGATPDTADSMPATRGPAEPNDESAPAGN
jgi:hypothetical protein